MADQPETVGEELAAALIVHMLRTGALSDDDVIAMAAGLSDEARDVANSLIIEAVAPSDSEWAAERARKRFRVVD